MSAAWFQLMLPLLLMRVDDAKNTQHHNASTLDWRRPGILMCMKLVPAELYSVCILMKAIQQSVSEWLLYLGHWKGCPSLLLGSRTEQWTIINDCCVHAKLYKRTFFPFSLIATVFNWSLDMKLSRGSTVWTNRSWSNVSYVSFFSCSFSQLFVLFTFCQFQNPRVLLWVKKKDRALKFGRPFLYVFIFSFMLDLYIFLEFKHFVLIVVNVHKYDILDFLVHIWKKS